MRIHLKALGCRLNEAEIEAWSRDFRRLGHQLTNRPEEADVVVVNTCAVTQEAVRKSRKLLRRAQRERPQAKLVVSGCYATLDRGGAEGIAGVDLVVDNRDKDRLVEITSQELDLPVMPVSATEPGTPPLLARGRHRAFVKVQDGCRYQCTFCIVTQARGEERSRPTETVVEEVRALHGEGVQEVVLTGVHIGGYGSDIGSDLATLVRRVLTETEIPRLRLGSVEPWDLPEGFWGLFENPRFMPHLHLPLQSGADTVLRRMARRCKREAFTRLVAQAQRNVPDFNVTTDIIVGFPGETEAEWAETLDAVAQIGFGHLHIFAFSPREGTRAASLPGQIDSATKRARSRQLHALGARLKRAILERHLGREMEVLVEGRENRDGVDWFGYTPNFLPVRIIAGDDALQANQIRRIRLEAVDNAGDQILGRVVSGSAYAPPKRRVTNSDRRA